MSELDTQQAKRLFAAIREIKGKALTQVDVDAINRALASDIISATHNGFSLGKPGGDLIKEFESYSGPTYRDPGPTGLPITGGWGTTRDERGRPLVLGSSKTLEEWEALFQRDVAATVAAVNTLIGDAPTTQNQFDALVSFAYNVGPDIDDDDIAEGLGDSTLLKKHLRGEYGTFNKGTMTGTGACGEFVKWNKSNGQVLKGLTRRRAREAVLYST